MASPMNNVLKLAINLICDFSLLYDNLMKRTDEDKFELSQDVNVNEFRFYMLEPFNPTSHLSLRALRGGELILTKGSINMPV